MIRKNLLQLVFSGACIWRWNDKLRPVPLSEIEKQAHKMLVCNLLWLESSKNMNNIESQNLAAKIIEGGLFDFFYRLILTDIKPPVYYRICENKDHYRQLTDYVLKNLEPVLSPLGPFWDRFKIWAENEDDNSIERQILKAAHLYASHWEFSLIKQFNYFDEEMESIEKSFTDDLAEYRHLPGMNKLLDSNHAAAKFASLCGQLRFQIRWTQTPRMPATSVLGHMFIVAVCAYLFSLSANACAARACNNFFSGLFHDFPEVLTRDIISPVKKSITGLSQLIREYEIEEMNRRVLLPLKKAEMIDFANKISWYLGLSLDSEFTDAYRINNEVKEAKNFADLNNYNKDEFDPKDGQLLKMCDLLAAFLEAYNSIRNGVTPPQIVEGRERLKAEILNKAPEKLKIDALLADFD